MKANLRKTDEDSASSDATKALCYASQCASETPKYDADADIPRRSGGRLSITSLPVSDNLPGDIVKNLEKIRIKMAVSSRSAPCSKEFAQDNTRHRGWI